MCDETKRALVILLLSKNSKELAISDEAMISIDSNLDNYIISQWHDPSRRCTMIKLIDLTEGADSNA